MKTINFVNKCFKLKSKILEQKELSGENVSLELQTNDEITVAKLLYSNDAKHSEVNNRVEFDNYFEAKEFTNALLYKDKIDACKKEINIKIADKVLYSSLEIL